MTKNKKLDKDKKELFLKTDELVKNFLIVLLHQATTKDPQEQYEEFNYNNYDFANYVLFDKSDKNTINKDGELTKEMLNTLKTLLSNDMIDKVYLEYIKLANNEGKSLLYTLSRLLYLQDKYKDDEIGQAIDIKIKEWLTLIKDYNKNKDNEQELEIYTKRLKAYVFYQIIPNVNFNIYGFKYELPFTYFNYEDFISVLDNLIKEKIKDSNTYQDYNIIINKYINDLESKVNNNNFYRDKAQEIQEIEDKYAVKDSTTISDETQEIILDDIVRLYQDYLHKEGNEFFLQDKDDIKKWRKKTDEFISFLEKYEGTAPYDLYTINNTLDHLAYNDYQKNTYKLDLDNIKEIGSKKSIKKYDRLLQATSRQLKAIDNARGGLVTYNETNTQALKNAIKEKQESLKNTHIKQDKIRLRQEISKLKSDLVIAEQKEKELKTEYKNVCDYLENIYKSMANEPKTSSYYKDLKKARKQQEQRKKELERILQFNGWQIDIWGNANYELILNKRKKESLKLTIENLTKQIAQYTKEEQDLFDFLISKYLHNTNNKEVKFTLREYENIKGRANANRELTKDIQAIRLLFREVWTYTTTDNNKYEFNEKHLFDNLNIKGKLESDLNNLNDANLDTKISIELTETLQLLLKDHDNYLYIKAPIEILQLNNDGEYLAKRLIKYLNYLVRVKKTSTLEISLDAIIEELQHYGLKHFNMLDKSKTFKTEIVDRIEKAINILEGDNHLNKRFIEVLNRDPFINYDDDFKGKKQETTINEWGKQQIKIKVYDLDNKKLLETKEKHKKNKKRKTTKE